VEARDEAASAGRGAVRELQTAVAGRREAAAGRLCGGRRVRMRRPRMPFRVAPGAGRLARRRFSGVLFREEGEAAASANKEPSVVPGSPSAWSGGLGMDR